MTLEITYKGKALLDDVLHEVVGGNSSAAGYDFRTDIRDIQWNFKDLESLNAAKRRVAADERLRGVTIRVLP